MQTLKNMNASVITNQPDYDYRFITYLLNEVFTHETLARTALYRSHTHGPRKFQSLDENKYSFVQNVFKERTKNDKNRFDKLSDHINKRCTIIRRSVQTKK